MNLSVINRPSADLDYMTRAVSLARKGLWSTHPNPCVGCVIVADDRVIGEGWHRSAGEPHAEINALAAAGSGARGATVYVSLEPCSHHGRTPPCTDALIRAGVKRVVIAVEDPNPQVAGSGIAALREAGIETEIGLLGRKAEALNRGFFSRHRKSRPYVTTKLAMSLDGRTALASGESKWITGEAARADVQRLRADAHGILTGIGTILADDPSLNVRLESSDALRQPVRVIVDTEMKTPSTAKVLGFGGGTIIFSSSNVQRDEAPFLARGASVERVGLDGKRLALDAIMRRLAELEVNSVLVEAGPTLNGALLEAGLIDELIIYIAPQVLGDTARPLFSMAPLASLADRQSLEFLDIRQVGEDCRITARPKRS